MNTLAELEAAVPKLTSQELIELERFVHEARIGKSNSIGGSALDLAPLDLGHMLNELPSRGEIYDEIAQNRL